MADGDDETAPVVVEDESARLAREAAECREIGRIIRHAFGAGAETIRISHYDGEYIADQMPGGRTAMREDMIEALRAALGEEERKRCNQCEELRPVTEFRRRSRDRFGRSTGNYRQPCNTCRKKRDEELRKVGRRA
jgi:hypothetical protein